MRFPVASLVLLSFPALLLGGCLFDPCDDEDCCQGCRPIVRDVYPVSLDDPDSLLLQMQVAHARREIDRYAELLAHDFVFRFQEGDITPELGPSLTFEQDSLTTRNMFASPEVTDIRLSLTGAPAASALWEGEEMQRVVLVDMLLEVDLSNGVTLRVAGQTQHYYFQWGRPERGEDPGRYYLRAWRDIGGASAPGSGLAEPASAAVSPVTWGGVLREYAPAGVESASRDR